MTVWEIEKFEKFLGEQRKEIENVVNTAEVKGIIDLVFDILLTRLSLRAEISAEEMEKFDERREMARREE